MEVDASPIIRTALQHKLIHRLPLTFQPYFNQEIQAWNLKFPYEQTYLERVVSYLDRLSPEAFENLFVQLRAVERRMSLDVHSFSLQEQNIESASVLARSPYYLAWREEVNRVFAKIHASSVESWQAGLVRLNRLLLQIFPGDLPLSPHDLLNYWPGAQLKELTAKPDTWDALVNQVLLRDRPLGEAWLFQAGAGPDEVPFGPQVVRLSFERLKAFREVYLDQIKSMRKSLADADTIMHHLRTVDVASWCPREIRDTPVVREFVRSLFLSNNGSQLFGNAFVEWGTTQALAHARPRVVVVEYGLRFKPKPFTSVAIFEDPATANPLPAEPDPQGSALDAGMLAYYAWLATRRYPECRRTACLCVFQNSRSMLLAGVEDFPLWNEPEPVSTQRLSSILHAWLG